jgi:protein phosphatase PTC2/3
MILQKPGIWDCMSNVEVVAFVRARIVEGHSLTTIAEKLMDNCLASDADLGGYGCDNMTVIIVGILGEWAANTEEWCGKMKARIEADGVVGDSFGAGSGGMAAREDDEDANVFLNEEDVELS